MDEETKLYFKRIRRLLEFCKPQYGIRCQATKKNGSPCMGLAHGISNDFLLMCSVHLKEQRNKKGGD